MRPRYRVFLAKSHREGRRIIEEANLGPYDYKNDIILATHDSNYRLQGLILEPEQVYLCGNWHHGQWWWETWNLLLCRFRVPGKQDLTQIHYIEG